MEMAEKISGGSPFDTYPIDPADLNLVNPFSLDQYHHWIFKKKVSDISRMSNIHGSDRGIIEERLGGPGLRLEKEVKSSRSETRKFLFRTRDRKYIEAVLIDNGVGAYTLCLSTQVGCPLKCQFCATGQMAFLRNLTAGEIVEQFFLLDRPGDRQIKNIVFMGMGEPFLNTRSLFMAIDLLSDPKTFGLSPRRISISTSGILKGIDRLIAYSRPVRLSVSLHAAIQETRDAIMPDFTSVPLEQLKEKLQAYNQSRKASILIEYVLLDGVNDRSQDGLALIRFVRGLKARVNLMAYNFVKGRPYRSPSAAKIRAFRDRLKKAGIRVTQRYKKGDDIDAACGQLAVRQASPGGR